MAKVNGNIVTANMSGQVAKQLVFIQKNGKTIVCKYNPQNEMYQFSKRNVHFLGGG